jgi:formiminotetrahydrofolate cyclodeaminase
MVGRLTIGKKKYSAVEKEMWQMVESAEQLRRQLTGMVREDAAAFEKVVSAMKLPKDTPEQESAHQQAVQTANIEAARVPLNTAQLALEVLTLSIQAAQLGNRNAISDAATASALAHAAIVGAGGNVRINLAGVTESGAGQPILADLTAVEEKAALVDQEIRRIVRERANLIIW